MENSWEELKYDEVPKWVKRVSKNFAMRHKLIYNKVAYFKGRNFLYKVLYKTEKDKGEYKAIFYRKKKTKRSKHKFNWETALVIILIAFYISMLIIPYWNYGIIVDKGKIENLILEKINEERVSVGLSPLVSESHLYQMAKFHSEDMAKRKYFSHTSPDGRTVEDRRIASGYTSSYVGENILEYPCSPIIGIYIIPIPNLPPSPEEISSKSVKLWMNSPGHRANILNVNYREIGIASAWDGPNLYITTDFGAKF